MTPVVLSRGWLLDATGRGAQLPAPWHFGHVAALAFRAGVDLVYEVDDGQAGAVPWGGAELDGWLCQVTGGEADHPDRAWRWSVKGSPPNLAGIGPVTIVRVQLAGGEAGPWGGLEARDLLAAFAAFERLTGVAWREGTGRTAESLILACHPTKRGGTTLDRSPVCPEPAANNTLEMAWQNWRRPLTTAEESMPYVHAFDARAQYLGAWIVTECGFGVPEVVDRVPIVERDGRLEPDYRQPALYKLAPSNYALDTGTLPPVALPGREWVTNVTLGRLEEWYGEGLFQVVQGWLWPRRARFLRAAGERLRDARAAAMSERAGIGWSELTTTEDTEAQVRKLCAAVAVESAVKDCYRRQTGRFGARVHRAGSPWYRPDWGHMVRATARCNLHRRLGHLSAHPFAIATDGLLFASDEPDGLAFANRIGLPLGDGLGKFSYDGTAPAELVHRPGNVDDLFDALADYQLGKVHTP